MTAPIRQPRASRAARFTQRDVARALKGALACGVSVSQVTIDRDGRICVIIATPGVVAPSQGNDWD